MGEAEKNMRGGGSGVAIALLDGTFPTQLVEAFTCSSLGPWADHTYEKPQGRIVKPPPADNMKVA